ncbi:hypothetical protein Zmor_005751 [Zophobas morio]|uniref:Uncharacterized protein n=1 Tax=Zophobas morio TaxID=2755281 RepID=A0AA38ITT5_9CUCU|nr:hypothetical protein Zmor_005751 [Zophobas morio]
MLSVPILSRVDTPLLIPWPNPYPSFQISWPTVNIPTNAGAPPLRPTTAHRSERGRRTSPSGFNKQTKVEIVVALNCPSGNRHCIGKAEETPRAWLTS